MQKSYLIIDNYVINLYKFDKIEESFINFIYIECYKRPLLWLMLTEELLSNPKICYLINTTMIISTYLIDKDKCYYFFKTLRKLLLIGAINKIIYKKEFIIVHLYNDYICSVLRSKYKWLVIVTYKLLLENNYKNIYLNSLIETNYFRYNSELLYLKDNKIINFYTINDIFIDNNVKSFKISIYKEKGSLKFNYNKKEYLEQILNLLI